MSKKSQSWLDFIRYIISFFLGRKKQAEAERKEEQKQVNAEIEERFDEVDREKEKKKKQDVKKRLDNMF